MNQATSMRPTLALLASEFDDKVLVMASRDLTYADLVVEYEMQQEARFRDAIFTWEAGTPKITLSLEMRSYTMAVGRTLAEAAASIFNAWEQEDAAHRSERRGLKIGMKELMGR